MELEQTTSPEQYLVAQIDKDFSQSAWYTAPKGKAALMNPTPGSVLAHAICSFACQ